MSILFILAVLGVGISIYAVYFLFFPKGTSQANKKERQDVNQQLFLAKEEKIKRLQEENTALKSELEKTKADTLGVKNEVVEAKKNIVALEEELKKRELWVSKSEEIVQKAKDQAAQAKEQLVAKEKELHEEFSQKINLNKTIKDAEEKIGLLEKEKRGLNDDICNLKTDIEKYKEELKSQVEELKGQKKILADLKNKQTESNWISKEEYNRLKDEYDDLKRELGIKKKAWEVQQEKLKALEEDNATLSNRLKKKSQSEIASVAEEASTSQKDTAIQAAHTRPEERPPGKETAKEPILPPENPDKTEPPTVEQAENPKDKENAGH